MNTKSEKTASGQNDFSELVAMHEARHRTNTQGVNHAMLSHVRAFFGRTPGLADFTEASCISFAKFLTGRVAANSAKTYLQKLHAILGGAAAGHLIPANPMPSIRSLAPCAKSASRVYLTHVDLSSLSKTPCRHDETKRAFLFACQTGLRLSDIETLGWDDIVDVNGNPTIVKVQVKTGREVCIPLNSIAMKLLGARSAGHRVFQLRSRSVIASDLLQWAKAAGLEKHLTFHVSRHTFATLSIAAGVDIYVVSRLCGHATVRTTEIYAHMIDRTLQRGVELLEKSIKDNVAEEGKKERMGIRDLVRRTLFPLLRRRGRDAPLYQ